MYSMIESVSVCVCDCVCGGGRGSLRLQISLIYPPGGWFLFRLIVRFHHNLNVYEPHRGGEGGTEQDVRRGWGAETGS